MTLWSNLQGLIHLAYKLEPISFFQQVVQWSAILLTALGGTYAARKQGLDYLGTLAIAFVVCVAVRFIIRVLATKINIVTS